MEKRLEDIARELNLSTATVSRALNRDTESLVKEKTRKLILDFVRRTGFKPNIKARALARRKLTNLFLVMSQNEDSIFYDHYFFKIIRGIHKSIIGTEYSLTVLPIKNDYTEEQIYKTILNHETAGLILSPYCSHLEFPYDAVRGYNFPVISLDSEIQGRNTYSLLLDHEGAGYKGAEILSKKYKNIVLISDKRRSLHSDLRRKGFYKFFENKKQDEYNIINLEYRMSYTSGLPALEEVLEKTKLPVGVFVLNDEIASSMVSNLSYKGLKCPEDIGIIGFDGLPITKYVSPILNSVAFCFEELGQTAAKIILKSLKGKRSNNKKIFLASITEGKSF